MEDENDQCKTCGTVDTGWNGVRVDYDHVNGWYQCTYCRTGWMDGDI